MRDAGIFSIKKALPRMSWSPKNLYNLYSRTVGEKRQDITFRFTNSTLFQQRWKSKAVVRAYHGDFINEKIFKRWYLPETLPDVRPRRKVLLGNDQASLEEFALRRQKEQDFAHEEETKGMAPVGSLMVSEVERRIDVFIFRCCFAHSVYEARRLVIHGDVLLNGKKHQNANTRLAPGDMVSVNPSAVRFFKAQNGAYYDVNGYDQLHHRAKPKDSIVSETQSESSRASNSTNASAEARQGSLESTNTTETSKSGSTPTSEGGQTSEASESSKLILAHKFTDAEQPTLTPFYLPLYASPWLFIPAYIEPCFATCSAIYVRHPTARPGYSEIPTPYDADGEVIRFAWEWYMQRNTRVRTKKQLARMPEDRSLAMIKDIESERRRFRRDLKRMNAMSPV